MNRHELRPAPLALAIALALGGAAAHAQSTGTAAPSGAPTQIHIAAQPLAQALNDWARQTRVQVIVQQGLVAGKTAPAVSGMLTARQALDHLLAGSGLVGAADGSAMVIRAVSAASESTLPAVVVTASADPETATGPVKGYVAKRSATGTKTDTLLLETPNSVSVIPEQQIEAQQPKTVTEALRYTPGVHAELAGSQFVGDQLTIRGFQQGTGRMLRDGTRTYLSNFLGWDAPEPYGLARIEVLRGANSVLYGSSDPGGQINLVSKRPTTEPLREVQLQAGSSDYRHGAFDLSDKLDEEGVWSYRLTGLVREADAQTDHIVNRRQFLAPALTYRPSASTELTVLAEYQKQTGNFSDPLPANGTVFSDARGRLPRGTYVGDSAYDFMTNEKSSIGYAFKHQIDDTWTVRQNLRYSDYRQVSSEIAIFGPAGDVFSRYNDQRNGNGKLFTVDNQVQANFSTGPVQHTLLAGVDYYKGKFDQQQSLNFIQETFDLYAPVYGQPLTFIPFSSTSYEQKMSQTGVYLQDQLKFDQWVFLAGGRYDWASDQNDARSPQTQKDGKFSSRLGIVRLFDNGLAPYASYSESFLPVAGTTIDNTSLKPETGKQYEIGVKYEPPGSNSLYTLALFDLTRQNVTETAQNFSRQEGEVRSRGIELEARTEVFRGFDLIGSYTWNDVEVTKSESGNAGKTPFRVPKQMVSLWGDYQMRGGPLSRLRMGLGARYVSSTFGDSANSFKVASHTVVDARISYPYDKVDLALNAVNLFDKKYVAGCFSDFGCQYGQKRTVYATMTYKW